VDLVAEVELETPALLGNKVNQEMLVELEIPVNQVMQDKQEVGEQVVMAAAVVMVDLLAVLVVEVLQEILEVMLVRVVDLELLDHQVLV
jgi:hypothetical protein